MRSRRRSARDRRADSRFRVSRRYRKVGLADAATRARSRSRQLRQRSTCSKPEVAALGTLHRLRGSPFSWSGRRRRKAPESARAAAAECRRAAGSASAFCGSVGRTVIEGRQRVAQVAAGSQRARAEQRGLAAARQRQGGIAPRTGEATARADAERVGDLRERANRPPVDDHSTRRQRRAAIAVAASNRSATCRGRRPTATAFAHAGCARSRGAPIRRGDGDAGDTAGFEAVQAIEHRERLVRRRAAVDRGLQQPARFVAVAALERRDAVLQQLFGLALPLGQRAARALDVGARARVAAIEKQRARPDVDRVLVAGGEVVVEADEQQLLDLRVAIRGRRGIRVGAGAVGDEADRT